MYINRKPLRSHWDANGMPACLPTFSVGSSRRVIQPVFGNDGNGGLHNGEGVDDVDDVNDVDRSHSVDGRQ